MKNVHVNEYCLGWHVYTHTGQVSAKRRGKESVTDISQWRLLNKDQRNVSVFLISSIKMRTAPFKKNGPIALTTGWDVCEVFWKQYFNQRRNWHGANFMGEGDLWHNVLSYVQWPATRRSASVPEDCHSVQVPGPPWRGGHWPDERTREDSANQMRVPWSTVKWWMTTWGDRGHCIGNRRTCTDEVSTNNYSWVVKLSTQTVSVTQNWPFLNLKSKVMKLKVRLCVVSI